MVTSCAVCNHHHCGSGKIGPLGVACGKKRGTTTAYCCRCKTYRAFKTGSPIKTGSPAPPHAQTHQGYSPPPKPPQEHRPPAPATAPAAQRPSPSSAPQPQQNTADLQLENQRLREQLAVSEEVRQNLAAENKRLQAENKRLQEQMRLQEQQLAALQSQTGIKTYSGRPTSSLPQGGSVGGTRPGQPSGSPRPPSPYTSPYTVSPGATTPRTGEEDMPVTVAPGQTLVPGQTIAPGWANAQAEPSPYTRPYVSDNGRECVLCLEQPRGLRLPCGHKVLCAGCVKSVSECPVCRLPFDRRRCVTDETPDTYVR